MTKIINNTTSLVRFILILFVLVFTINTNAQEIKIVDNKGTVKTFKNNQTKTSNPAPSNPIEGDIWFDTSTNPNTLKIWKDPDWVVFPLTENGVNNNVIGIYSGSLKGQESVTLTNLTSDAIGIRIIYIPSFAGPTNRQMIYDIYRTGAVDKGYIQGIGTGQDATFRAETVYSFSKIRWATKEFTHEHTGYVRNLGNTGGSNHVRNNSSYYSIKKIFEIR